MFFKHVPKFNTSTNITINGVLFKKKMCYLMTLFFITSILIKKRNNKAVNNLPMIRQI